MKKLGNYIILIIFIGLIAIIGSVILVNSNSPDRRLNEQLELAEKYLDDLDYEQAIAAYMNAIEIDPKCELAYIALAEIYMEQGDLDSAQSILEQASELLETQQISEKLEYVSSLREQLYQVEKVENIESMENKESESDVFEILNEVTSDSEESLDEEITEDTNMESTEQDSEENESENAISSTDYTTEDSQEGISQESLETGGTWIDELFNNLVSGNYLPVAQLLSNQNALKEAAAPYIYYSDKNPQQYYDLVTSGKRHIKLSLWEDEEYEEGDESYWLMHIAGGSILISNSANDSGYGDYSIEFNHVTNEDGYKMVVHIKINGNLYLYYYGDNLYYVNDGILYLYKYDNGDIKIEENKSREVH